MFLTPADLAALTGYRRGAEQCRWLTNHGVPHFVRRDGKPVVVRVAYERWENPPPQPAPEEVDESLIVPPFDEGVYRPMAEIYDARIKYILGMDLPYTGVYFLFRDGDLLYIGLSNQVPLRLRAHYMRRLDCPSDAIWFNEASVIEVHTHYLRRVEEFYIDREQPPCNIRGIRWT